MVYNHYECVLLLLHRLALVRLLNNNVRACFNSASSNSTPFALINFSIILFV